MLRPDWEKAKLNRVEDLKNGRLANNNFVGYACEG